MAYGKMLGMFNTNNPTQQNIVIIGLGPTGLAMAIEACKNDTLRRNVIAITDREQYTREAIFRLDVDIIPYLAELVGQDKIDHYFESKLIGPKESLNGWDFHIIQMKTLEQLLYETLISLPNIEVLCLPKRSNCHIKDIDSDNHTVTVVQQPDTKATERVIGFKYLIAADGPSHNTVNRVVGNQIIYETTQLPQIHMKHARVTYKLPADLCVDTFRSSLLPVNTPISDLRSLKNLGWTLNSSPEIRAFVVDGVLFAAAECPEQLDNDIDKIDLWMQAVLGLICTQSINALTRIDAALFDVSLAEANRTVIPLPGKSKTHDETAYLLPVGDALRNTHYQTGSGAVVGLQEARALGSYLKGAQSLSDLETYHAQISDIRAANRMRVDTFITKRNERETKAAALAESMKTLLAPAKVLNIIESSLTAEKASTWNPISFLQF